MYRGIKLGVAVLAGGTGKRMSREVPKQFIELDQGMSILEKSVASFMLPSLSDVVDDIVVISPAEYMEETEKKLEELSKAPSPSIHIAEGGEGRQDSTEKALGCFEDLSYGEEDIVMIHDAARPFITESIIRKSMESAFDNGASITAVPVKDTIRDEIGGTLERSGLYQVQTPQSFRFGIIREAVRKAKEDGFKGTDDGSLVERMGTMPAISEGSYSNIKITTPDDLRGIAAGTPDGEEMDKDIRIGQGFDVHELVPERKLILGGIEIPYEKGLLGHSDADALTHSLMDALLGALSLGDIGHLFPDDSDEFLGADSMVLLSKVMELIKERGYSVGNADITVICQKPKLAPYIEKMRERLAAAMGIDQAKVSVKATTTEHLGFTGRGEGIASQAVALLVR